jgi:Tol biopolymer transport system component
VVKRRGVAVGLLALLALASVGLMGCGDGQGSTRAAGLPTESIASNLGKVAYELDGSIYVKDLPNGEPRRLGEGAMPRWSPSGEWLLFLDPGGWEAVARSDGRGESRRMTGFDAVWSPRDDRLAYGQWSVERSPWSLIVETADGSTSREVAAIDGSPCGRVHWSPDGARLAYSLEAAMPERRGSLWVVDVDGGSPLELASSTGDGLLVAGWTADGAYVLFWRDIQFSASMMADGLPLEAVPAQGGPPLALAAGHLALWAPSPVDGRIAMTTSGRMTWTRSRVFVVDAAGGALRYLTPEDRASIQPAWSPDGARIAFVSKPDAGDGGGGPGWKLEEMAADRRIWLMNADGSEQRPLTDDAAYRDEYPLWSADGSQILFARLDGERHASLWLMSADGGEPRRVVDAIGSSTEPLMGYYTNIGWGGMFDWWQPSPSPQAVPTPLEGATAAPGGAYVRHTGVAEVDAIIDAFFARDVAGLAALVHYTTQPCVEGASVASPPECPAGIEAGTPVDVLPVYSCEGSYIWPDQINEYFSNLVNDDQELYGVYRNRNGEPNDYEVVLTNWTVPTHPHPTVLSVSDGRLVAFAYGCGQTAFDIANNSGPAVLPYAHVTEARHTGRRTGIEDVDAIIDAVESRDSRVLRHLLQFTPIACTANLLGLGGPPLCRPDEADGTIVDAFPVASCEGLYLRPDEMDGLLDSLTVGQLSLYAVYVPKAGSWPGGDYVAVFARPVSQAGVIAEEVFITDGRIVGVGDGCGVAPEATVQDDRFDRVILPPP